MMRRFVIVLLFAITINSYSQEETFYTLFAEEGTEWSIGVFSESNPLPYDMVYLKLSGDTTINDTIYHCIRKLDGIHGQIIGSAGFVRLTEDSLLFYRCTEENEGYFSDKNEGLIFDYKLNLNDTISLNPVISGNILPLSECEPGTQPASITDTCYKNINGIMKKSYFISNGAYPQWGTWWTEGLGSHSGMWTIHLNLSGWTGGSQQLFCAWLNGVKIYDNPDYGYCEYTNMSENKSKDFSIFPSPCSEKFHLSISKSDVGKRMVIYTVFGEIVLDKRIKNKEMEISVGHLKPGIYTVNIENKIIEKLIIY
ncbi:MAG: T9SS type A sorting domain-containing protein [Bacteroidota bacterium]